MIQGLSRLCAAPSKGLVMRASRGPIIVQCSTIASASASGISIAGPATAESLSRNDDVEPRRRNASAPDQSQHEQQDDRPHRGGVDGADPEASDRRKMELAPQETTDEAANDADDDVADQAVAAALHDFPGKPAGDGTDQHRDKKSL